MGLSRGVMSVPPRGSGWVGLRSKLRKYPSVPTPLPRGGTDLVTTGVPSVMPRQAKAYRT